MSSLMSIFSKLGYTEVPGGVTAAKGFKAGGVFAGIKTPGEDKYDLGILASDTLCTVAGTFTRNSIVSPSVALSKEVVGRGTARAIVANSGCANTAVGEQGMIDARETARLAARRANISSEDVLVASTGVIGEELPMGLIRRHIRTIELSEDGGTEFAKSIMTTDTHHKEYAVQFDHEGKTVTVGGCAKGAGMIHPNMATMLAFITTDAHVEPALLQSSLSSAVERTFNQIDVDGDQSTNDTVALLANGASGARPTIPTVRGMGDWNVEGVMVHGYPFLAALALVCRNLAISLARDGEGAQHLITAEVRGAHSDEDALQAARGIVSSSLVKTAVYGRDPNWGRIMMAVGATGIPLDESKIAIFINDIHIVDEGKAIAFNTQSVISALGEQDVDITVDLNVGDGTGTAWGSDLTEDYVVFNSAYTT